MRRRAPRPLSEALSEVAGAAAPATLLAAVQGCWDEVVGAAVAAEARPVSERDGTLVVACRSAAWANELELLGPELADRLNAALGGSAPRPVAALRAKVADAP